jgi:hypothetical protein
MEDQFVSNGGGVGGQQPRVVSEENGQDYARSQEPHYNFLLINLLDVAEACH